MIYHEPLSWFIIGIGQKSAFRALDVFQKPSRPSSGVVKTDLEV